MFRLRLSRSASRSLAERLPEGVAAAVLEFITGDLLRAPRRVGKPLRHELAGHFSARRGVYRVIYDIDDQHDIVTVLVIEHRHDAYRT